MSAAETMTDAPSDAGWIAIGRTADIPTLEGASVTVNGRRIAVFHLSDGWAAIDGDCPHRGGPLADGIVADCSVTCPLHNRRFDLSSGAKIEGDEPGVVVHEVHEESGRLLLRLAEST